MCSMRFALMWRGATDSRLVCRREPGSRASPSIASNRRKKPSECSTPARASASLLTASQSFCEKTRVATSLISPSSDDRSVLTCSTLFDGVVIRNSVFDPHAVERKHDTRVEGVHIHWLSVPDTVVSHVRRQSPLSLSIPFQTVCVDRDVCGRREYAAAIVKLPIGLFRHK